VIEAMLKQAMTVLSNNDRKLVAEVSRMDNIVDRLDEAIKLYVTKLTRESLDDREGARAMEIVAFAINLEHIGDIVDKNLMELAAKKIKHKYEFCPFCLSNRFPTQICVLGHMFRERNGLNWLRRLGRAAL
jgi:phosphate:Na+ symporter